MYYRLLNHSSLIITLFSLCTCIKYQSISTLASRVEQQLFGAITVITVLEYRVQQRVTYNIIKIRHRVV